MSKIVAAKNPLLIVPTKSARHPTYIRTFVRYTVELKSHLICQDSYHSWER